MVLVCRSDWVPHRLVGVTERSTTRTCVRSPSVWPKNKQTQRRKQSAMHEEQIKQKAYEIWLAEGRPEGRADIHWAMASATLRCNTSSGSSNHDDSSVPHYGEHEWFVEHGAGSTFDFEACWPK